MSVALGLGPSDDAEPPCAPAFASDAWTAALTDVRRGGCAELLTLVCFVVEVTTLLVTALLGGVSEGWPPASSLLISSVTCTSSITRTRTGDFGDAVFSVEGWRSKVRVVVLTVFVTVGGVGPPGGGSGPTGGSLEVVGTGDGFACGLLCSTDAGAGSPEAVTVSCPSFFCEDVDLPEDWRAKVGEEAAAALEFEPWREN